MIEILQPDHPMLRGLRFFAFGDNVVQLRNVAGRGGSPGVAAGGPTISRLGTYQAINGDATDNIVTFGNFVDYFGSDSRDITVLMRVRANSAHVGIIAGSRSAGPASGWQFLYSNGGGSEDGYNFTVWSSGNKFMEAMDGVGEANIRSKNVVFGGVYIHSQHECYSFLRNEGEPSAKIRNAHTNTNSGNTSTENWDVRAGANPLTWLALAGPATPFNGDLAWMAVFDRALTNDEIAEWSIDEAWPFLEDYPIVTSFVARLYETRLLVNQSAGYTQAGGRRNEANAIDAAVYTAGDLVSASQPDGPGSGITKSFATVVGVATAETIGQPQLKKFTTVVGAAATISRGFTKTFATVVGASQTKKLTLDGRVDLMFTTGYRR